MKIKKPLKGKFLKHKKKEGTGNELFSHNVLSSPR